MRNTTNKNLLIGLAALSTVALSAPAQADGQWFIGGSVAQSYVDENGLDDDDTGGKIFGGYQFNKHFSIEGSYYDFGEATQGSNGLELDGFGLAAVGTIPVSAKFSLFGKVGIHDWDADTLGSTNTLISRSSDTDAFYGVGVGVGYSLTDSLSLRGELERYEIDDLDVDVVSVGISFSF